ncbi:MAG: hypothetical protein GC146_11355 [Limimaricola sp.]|uniref:hypothetical protein n=1 Tax=Limimaricola sp. TaxID=2211665 RepID=UPI001D693969|nr:hypothetical protein [Limimaricola sp.]MBI1417810.1 hypothetical protein [Limimaricola sp.]
MLPFVFVAGHPTGRGAVGPHPAGDRLPARRHQPAQLRLMPDPHRLPEAVDQPAMPQAPADRPRATLVQLAADPRFARGRDTPPPPGLRLWLGQQLMQLGFFMVHPRRPG